MPTQFLLIRHAPVAPPARLAGRSNVPCILPARIPSAPAADRVLSSPATRCTATARALYPDATIPTDPRLWEQDFGAWEGLDFSAMPDLGRLEREQLAAHRPPGGESHADMAGRVAPALQDLATGGTVAVVAHAGTIRVALGLALGQMSQGLAFAIAPLSLTRLSVMDGEWAILSVNEPLR